MLSSLYDHNIDCCFDFLEDNVKYSVSNLIFFIEKKSHLIPPVIIISGMCGTGKSYITKVIIDKLKRINYRVVEYFFTNINELREVVENYYMSFSKLCMSIEEAHMLNTHAQSFILTTLEKSKNIFVILTTSQCHLLNEALISRSYMITTNVMSKQIVHKFLLFLNNKYKHKNEYEINTVIQNCHENTFRNVINYYHFNCSDKIVNIIECCIQMLMAVKEKKIVEFNTHYQKIQTLKFDTILQIIYNGVIGTNELTVYINSIENINILLQFYAHVKCYNTLRLLILLLSVR